MFSCFEPRLANIYGLILLAAVLIPLIASADPRVPADNPQLSLEQMQALIEALQYTIANQSETALILLQRLQLLEQKVAQQSEQIKQDTLSEAPEPDPIIEQENAELAKKIADERVENARLIETAFEQKLIDAGGLLMQAGDYSYEPSFSYVNSSVDRIIIDGFSLLPVLVVGDIVSEQVRREIITITNTFRMGLPKDYQLELQIPYGYEKQAITAGDGRHDKVRTSGLGDISLSLSHQLIKSSSFWPDTLISLGWKSKTGQDPFRLTDSEELALGTGFSSFNISITAISVSDPLAFYYGMAITKTPRDLKSIGYIKPGGSVRLHLGSSLAINLDTSVSLGFQLSYIADTEFEGIAIPGSDYTTSTLSLGMSRKLSNRTSLEFDIGIGLTEDAPDFQLTMAYPVRF